jgi:hypothetical protein
MCSRVKPPGTRAAVGWRRRKRRRGRRKRMRRRRKWRQR